MYEVPQIPHLPPKICSHEIVYMDDDPPNLVPISTQNNGDGTNQEGQGGNGFEFPGRPGENSGAPSSPDSNFVNSLFSQYSSAAMVRLAQFGFTSLGRCQTGPIWNKL